MWLIAPLKRPLWLAASLGEGALEVALSLVREVRSALENGGPSDQAPEPAVTKVEVERPTFSRKPRPRSRPASRPPRRAPGEPRRAAPRAPVSDAVKTVDDAPVPVAEFGEQGAEESAGAEVRVDAPWEGYDAMRVVDLKARLAEADREVLAAVVLYESLGRGRRSVIDAAEKRLKRLSVPGA